jgi:HD-GYP domain-containing protein (c-di-GMP phosphodiesterase class II)
MDHVRKGEPFPYDLLDHDGKILLKNGYVIDDLVQIQRLIDRGAFFDEIINEEPEARPANNEISTFRQVCDLLDTFNTLASGEEHVPSEILTLATRIQHLCELDGDACLANIQLDKRIRYSLRHSFHTALLTEMLIAPLEVAKETRADVVAAALTMNFSMLELQDVCYQNNTPLTLAQKQAIIAHPLQSVEYLKSLGVDNEVWLKVVEHHHEMMDGSGYPKRLKKDDLTIHSQAVSLADRYCAMVTERAYRPGVLPDAAARTLLVPESAKTGPELTETFIKVVGHVPPGSVVKLVNGDAALVVRRLLKPAQPLVRSLRSGNGIRYSNPPKRATSHPSHSIKEVLDTSIAQDHDVDSFWQVTLPDGTGDA